jgi:putative ABC transport system ATP-binding protein
MDLIAMDGISKEYSTRDGATTRVLKSIELFVEPGEFLSIMGPSGSGKSTLVNLLGTLDRPTEGVYLLDGQDTRDCDDAALAHVRNRTIGFVFQGFNLLARRTLVDNVALPLVYGGEDRKEQQRRAEYYLEQVGLAAHRSRFPSELSGGQQQRVAIARALIGEPKILLADEPTGALDSQTSKEIMALLCALNKEGITIILITHDVDIANYGQRLVQLKDGVIIYDGPKY